MSSELKKSKNSVGTVRNMNFTRNSLQVSSFPKSYGEQNYFKILKNVILRELFRNTFVSEDKSKRVNREVQTVN